MPLDPQVVAYRASRAAAGTPPLYTQTLAEARAADLAAIRAGGGDAEPVHEVRDLSIPGPGAMSSNGYASGCPAWRAPSWKTSRGPARSSIWKPGKATTAIFMDGKARTGTVVRRGWILKV